MTKDRLFEGFYNALPRNRHDGILKDFREDCEGCDFYRKATVGIEERLSNLPHTASEWFEHRCYWGVAMKVLSEPEDKRRKCGLDFEKSPRKIAFDENREWRERWG